MKAVLNSLRLAGVSSTHANIASSSSDVVSPRKYLNNNFSSIVVKILVRSPRIGCYFFWSLIIYRMSVGMFTPFFANKYFYEII